MACVFLSLSPFPLSVQTVVIAGLACISVGFFMARWRLLSKLCVRNVVLELQDAFGHVERAVGGFDIFGFRSYHLLSSQPHPHTIYGSIYTHRQHVMYGTFPLWCCAPRIVHSLVAGHHSFSERLALGKKMLFDIDGRDALKSDGQGDGSWQRRKMETVMIGSEQANVSLTTFSLECTVLHNLSYRILLNTRIRTTPTRADGGTHHNRRRPNVGTPLRCAYDMATIVLTIVSLYYPPAQEKLGLEKIM